jgi:hypothetical protein
MTGGVVGEMFDWQILSGDPAGSPVVSTTSFDYKLRNRTYRERLAYGERRYGINLVWVPVELDPFNVRIVREDGPGQVADGNRVAIGIDDGGYLKYQSRDYGINLVWSDSPIYEWEIRTTDDGSSGSPVNTGDNVGLYNMVEDDFLFYDPRRYGINLKWLRDEGKFNDSPWWEDVGDAITGGWSYIFNGIKEAFWRIIGIPDFILSVLGILIPKKMRVRVTILRDVDGKALFGDEELPQSERERELQLVQDAIDLLREVFKEEANIKVIAAGDDWINIAFGPAPSYALTAPCGFDLFKEGLSRAGAYYRRVAYKDTSGFLIGYAQPITAIVVKDITDKRGCSLGPLTSYLLIDVSGFDVTQINPRASTLAHEIGHQNGCWHRPSLSNLMYKGVDRGTNLSRWQRAIIRDSRYVTFL